MQNKILLTGLLLSLVSFTCKDSTPTGPLMLPVQTFPSFRMQIIVQDSRGSAIPGVRIGGWQTMTIGPRGVNLQGLMKSAYGTTAIGMDVPQRCRTVLITTTMQGGSPQILMNRVSEPGSYTVAWSSASMPGVYRIRFIAASMTGETIWYDNTVLAVKISGTDPIGVTGSDGSYTTTNADLFPGLFMLPPMLITDVSPDPVGTFYFRPEFHFDLMELETGLSQGYDYVVTPGQNTLRVIWNPEYRQGGSIAASREVPGNSVLHPADPDTVSPISVIPRRFLLRQNYPNPF